MGQETEQRASHTPGPWQSETGNPFNVVQLGDGPSAYCWAASFEGGEAIEVEQERQDADARLIAAAPDLLAALKEIIEHPFSGGARRLWTQARAAIAKAEGRS